MYKTCFIILLLLWCLTSSLDGEKLSRESYTYAQNDFAFDLYEVLKVNDGRVRNVFFSSYSIYTALAMIRLAAGGTTCDEISSKINWMEFEATDKANNGHMAFRNFTLLNEGIEQKEILKVANKLYFQRHFANDYMRNKFLPRLRKYYDAEVGIVNFALNPDAARKVINSWIEQRTYNKIRDMLKPGMLTRLTRLMLVNAIHLKLPWKIEFNKKKTRLMPFYLKGRDYAPVKMMAVESKFKYTENDLLKAVELPYDHDFSMIVFVPNEGRSLADIEGVMSAGVLRDLLRRMTAEDVDVRLPKFQLECQFNLKRQLMKLGIHKVFNPAEADLSGILGVKGFYVSEIVHKAFIDVTEEGTEAAAATAEVSVLSAREDEKFVVANRPFLFAITSQHTNALIFMGSVLNPLDEQSGYSFL